jgi:hypothetical protein
MTEHQYTYSPAAESQQTKREKRTDVLYAIATVVCFAGIGVLLAWRG